MAGIRTGRGSVVPPVGGGRSAVVAALLLCGALSPAIYIGADLAAAARYPGYSASDQAVSELFAIGAPTSSLVVPLFTASSVLLLAFAGGVWRSAGRNRWRRLLAVAYAASALDALVLWNFFPMHMRGAERTATDTMHLILAVNPGVPLSLVFGAAAFTGRFRAYTVGTLLLLTVLAAHGFSYADAIAANAATPGLGLSERLAQYGYGVWEVALAFMLWRTAVVAASVTTETRHALLGVPIEGAAPIEQDNLSLPPEPLP
jgi:Protein of unknown function (DUF998)